MLTSGLCYMAENLCECVELCKPPCDLSEAFIIWLTDVYQSSMCKKFEFLACVNCCFPPEVYRVTIRHTPADDLVSIRDHNVLFLAASMNIWVCWSWALNAFIHEPLYKWSNTRLLDLKRNKSSAFRFTGLETIIEILLPLIYTSKLDSSVAHFGKMPLRVPEFLWHT